MLRKELTTEQKVRRKLLENRAWLHNNFNEVQRKFADMWIAVLDKRVVASNKSIEEVKKIIAERAGEAVVIRIPSETVPTPI